MDLVADIGATNARFQFCQGSDLLHTPIVLPTAQYKDAKVLLRAAVAALGGQQPERALLAVAGPMAATPADSGKGSVSGGHAYAGWPGEIEVTNTGLRFKAMECAAILGCRTSLVNDFYALAHGVPHFVHLVQIGGGDVLDGAKALLGPGSGLGMATLVPARTAQWRVLASEGGHADLAPGSHLEAELWDLLMTSFGHVSWETVLCGAGLQRLYTAMCELWGVPAETLSPVQISTRGIDMTDLVCHQTLETFCGLLGAAAGNLALTVGALGGVYISGGIVPQILEFVRSSPLRRRFEERGARSGWVQAIPLLIITEENPGLQGAAHCLQLA